jgi:hypothetical protein
VAEVLRVDAADLIPARASERDGVLS